MTIAETISPAAVLDRTQPSQSHATPVFHIDPAHSEAGFRVRHLLTHVRGRFSRFSGTMRFDPARPEQSSVSFAIDVASIDTNQPDRDAHLRSTDFFDVDHYPTLTFESREVSNTGENTFDVAGELTIRGITRPIVLPVTYLGEAQDPWGNRKLAFETETTINRKDYGLTWNMALETGGFLVGDEVKVTLSIQATRQVATGLDKA